MVAEQVRANSELKMMCNNKMFEQQLRIESWFFGVYVLERGERK